MSDVRHSDSDERRVAANPDVLAKPVGGEVVLVNMRTNRIYELNRTAGRLWELVGEGLTLGEIQARLVDEFGAEREQVRLEVEAMVEELLDEQLLVRA